MISSQWPLRSHSLARVSGRWLPFGTQSIAARAKLVIHTNRLSTTALVGSGDCLLALCRHWTTMSQSIIITSSATPAWRGGRSERGRLDIFVDSASSCALSNGLRLGGCLVKVARSTALVTFRIGSNPHCSNFTPVAGWETLISRRRRLLFSKDSSIIGRRLSFELMSIERASSHPRNVLYWLFQSIHKCTGYTTRVRTKTCRARGADFSELDYGSSSTTCRGCSTCLDVESSVVA